MFLKPLGFRRFASRSGGFAARLVAHSESFAANCAARPRLPAARGQRFAAGRDSALLKILIVEDEPLLAATLKHLVELNPRYLVTALADDFASAIAAAESERPDLALVDLQLANATSGFSVAAKLHELGILCLFTTGKAPGFPVPDLAIGCLAKPFQEADLGRALSEAEDILRGREKLVRLRRLPEQLEIYANAPAPAGQAQPAGWTLQLRGRTSVIARLRKLLRSPASFRSAVAQREAPLQPAD
jgi:CheY-like chemotaxis protein